ncbi:hypothetical protein HZS_7401 [Henneguya salminicola]|nr:hypothetical protein HZS_7401 [Henneguya salminicola]
MVGLDSSGKTAILYKLANKEASFYSVSTVGYNVETIQYRNLSFDIWDVSGQVQNRPLWRYHYKNSKALIFVIDSANPHRLPEAYDELKNLLSEPELHNCILLVYANKQDKENTFSVVEITNILQLKTLTNNIWYIQPSNAIDGTGLYEGLDWLQGGKLNNLAHIEPKNLKISQTLLAMRQNNLPRRARALEGKKKA